jgi:hypothetical protein
MQSLDHYMQRKIFIYYNKPTIITRNNLTTTRFLLTTTQNTQHFSPKLMTITQVCSITSTQKLLNFFLMNFHEKY